MFLFLNLGINFFICRFCIFGDTVNMACRMASTGNPGSIQLSELTANTLMEKFPSFMLEERGMIDVKVSFF